MKDLSTLSKEELNKKLKSLKLINGLLIGIVVMLAFLEIREFLQSEKFDFMMVMPVVFLGAIVVNFSNQKKMEKELASRD